MRRESVASPFMTMTHRLLLIDGNGVFYRSFFAIRNLSARDGHPTNAVFGFIRACHQWIDMLSPTHVAVAWDGGVPRERLNLIPEYKAQRPPMPDALRAQLPDISEFLDRAMIPMIRLEEQEADDVLASLAEWAVGQGAEVLMATSDKDMFQVVGDRMRIVPAAKDAPLIDSAAVLEKTGVHPAQIVDWLALTGDTVDNIPGVPGLGPKTAARLLGLFQDLDALWLRLAEVESARLRDSLVQNRAIVERNRQVVRLNRGLECSPGWTAMERKAEESARMRSFYERMEFHSLMKGMEQPTLL